MACSVLWCTVQYTPRVTATSKSRPSINQSDMIRLASVHPGPWSAGFEDSNVDELLALQVLVGGVTF
jgi:hypothetical protein